MNVGYGQESVVQAAATKCAAAHATGYFHFSRARMLADKWCSHARIAAARVNHVGVSNRGRCRALNLQYTTPSATGQEKSCTGSAGTTARPPRCGDDGAARFTAG